MYITSYKNVNFLILFTNKKLISNYFYILIWIFYICFYFCLYMLRVMYAYVYIFLCLCNNSLYNISISQLISRNIKKLYFYLNKNILYFKSNWEVTLENSCCHNYHIYLGLHRACWISSWYHVKINISDGTSKQRLLLDCLCVIKLCISAVLDVEIHIQHKYRWLSESMFYSDFDQIFFKHLSRSIFQPCFVNSIKNFKNIIYCDS